MFDKRTLRQIGLPSFAATMLVIATLACGGEVAPTEVREATSPPPATEEQPEQPTQPTSTPEPTPTPIVVVVTATPQDTPTPVPPTLAPAPTNTPVPPAPTVPKDTPPGSILEVGESWRQNGVRLKLEEVRFFPNSECLTLAFNLFNETDHEIIVTIEEQDFYAEDNLGRRWQLFTLTASGVWCQKGWISDLTDIVAAGDRFRTTGYDYWKVAFSGFLTDTNVDQVIVTVDGLSQIANAKWRIPIYH